MRRINANEAAQVIPRLLDVVTAARGDTVQSLASRMAYGNAQVERFRVLNGLASNVEVVPGEKYKITLPDGETLAEGTLDDKGFARVDGIDPGNCKISFPDLDEEVWSPK